jgi:hypothetical protein
VTGTVNPNFTGLSLLVAAGTTTRVLLTVDISASATWQQTLGMEMTSESAISLQNSVDDVEPYGGTWPQPAAAGDYTLPVEFSLFAGLAGYGSNAISWRTESEVNSLGFRLWRAETLEPGVVPVTAAFTAVADWLSSEELLGQENSSSATDYRHLDREIEPGVSYCYRLEAVDLDGSSEFHPDALFVTSLSRPLGYALDGNTPNPFNPVTSIRFTLPESVPVELSIYNLLGERVRRLVQGETLNWGPHVQVWDGANDQGRQVASGTYIYQLSTPGFQQARTMQLLR